MIWPWSRIRELEREVDRERTRADALVGLADRMELHLDTYQRDYARLLGQMAKQVADMRRDGFNPPPPTARASKQEDLPDPILAALASRAKPGSELYREMYADAQTMLMAGREVKDIETEIYEGGAE